MRWCIGFSMYENSYPDKRFKETLIFLQNHLPPPCQILDLGVTNPMAEIMRKAGYEVQNTKGEDLDTDFSALKNTDAEAVTAFEILEHLLNPYTVLKNLKVQKLVLTVPLKLWFSNAYQNPSDPRDRHFHEFESWQLDWLLQATGWEIKATKKWTHPVQKIGLRPLLRRFTPRYYAVYAERK